MAFRSADPGGTAWGGIQTREMGAVPWLPAKTHRSRKADFGGTATEASEPPAGEPKTPGSQSRSRWHGVGRNSDGRLKLTAE